MKYYSRWSENSIQRRIKKGYGQGYKEKYQPWLTVNDVPSSGVVSRVKGILVPRVHHLMSGLELNYFRILQWSDHVFDIREQFPLLERENAQYIAETKGIKYPTYPKTDVPVVLTSDFAIQLKDDKGKIVEVIRTVKPSSELSKKRVLEKLEIEREYWLNKGIDWGIVTEKEMNPVLLYNLNFFQDNYYYSNELMDLDQGSIIVLEEIVLKPEINILDILNALDKDLNQTEGTFLAIFKYMLSRKFITFDMNQKINMRNLNCKDFLIENGVKSS